MTESLERFDVYFAGESLEGFDPAVVRSALGKLFKADAAKLDLLFSGKRQLIKRDCDRDTALKFQRAMKSAGARPLIVPRRQETPTPETVSEPLSSTAALSLAPSGSDVLTPEERQGWHAADIDTSHLTAEPAGANLGEKAAVAPSVTAPDYDLADAGSDLGPPQEQRAATTDAGDFTLAEGDFDLSDCAPEPPKPPEVALDHLAVAEPGKELIDESERKRRAAEVPDTSHLSISTPSEDS